jgi:hemerythrin
MTLLIWDKHLSVGTPSIEAQHKLLVEALNELHNAVMRGESRTVTGLLLRTFIAYTRNHHTSEEALMARVGYPDLSQHRALHRELMENLESQLAHIDRGEGVVSIEFLHFLRDWLANHIQKVDRAYLPWILRHTTLKARAASALAQTSKESCVEANNGSGLASDARS